MKEIKLIVYDFDGVMTDNHVFVDENGKETVMVNRGDGWGVNMIRALGIRQVIISTEVNPVVEKRANKLKLDVIHGVDDKRITLIKYCEQEGIDLQDVMYIGNDLNDYEAMNVVGVKGVPADAEPEVKKIADWVSRKNGGDGVVRDLARTLSEVASV
ncbi:MAG: 3-deoxy-D-manno-octulosonate 8-phosphate phosphatase KdsC [Firmicutes bacterium ADurb.Bin354]|nr:MAG: 3-deoxy-D-manno-octulosonate 8-phosphate phosphatase KdsC [Firmicutes bacterium ADurb.Bin354]